MPATTPFMTKFWQKGLRPFLRRISIRVSLRGFVWVCIWASLVVLYGLFKLLLTKIAAAEWMFVCLNLLFWLTVVVSVVLILALVIDYWRLMTATSHQQKGFINHLQFSRRLHSNLSVQNWTKVLINVSIINNLPSHRTQIDNNQSLDQYQQTQAIKYKLQKFGNLKITLIDNFTDSMTAEDLPVTFSARQILQTSEPMADLAIASNQQQLQNSLDITYHLYPNHRGVEMFFGIDLLLQTSLGLLTKFEHVAEDKIVGNHQIRVLPNFNQLMQGAILGVSKKTANLGMLRQRNKGQGQDFNQIRQYTDGDSIRHLDWKATSRFQRLMTREYHDEREQQILFLIDCGQNMRHFSQSDGVLVAEKNWHETMTFKGNHLDQALNAMLVLAEIANRQGDATGFISFASEDDKIVAPKKGKQVIHHLLNQCFDIQPSSKAPDYIAAARMVRQIINKRSLIIFITNTRQEDQAELFEAIKLLSSSHLVILANLYEQDLKNFYQQPFITENDALTFHTIEEYFNTRATEHLVFSTMANVYPISCTPEQLSSLLVNQYLSLKSRSLL